MANVKIFYGSTNGNTENVAGLIKENLGDLVSEVTNIAGASTADLESADALILGTSTWNDGNLQEDWENFLPDMDSLNLSGKTVALFGLGDSSGYPSEFVNGMGLLYNKVKERGAKIIGAWPTDGYIFEESISVVDGKFVGLVIDEDNEPNLTDERVKTWCDSIRASLG